MLLYSAYMMSWKIARATSCSGSPHFKSHPLKLLFQIGENIRQCRLFGLWTPVKIFRVDAAPSRSGVQDDIYGIYLSTGIPAAPSDGVSPSNKLLWQSIQTLSWRGTHPHLLTHKYASSTEAYTCFRGQIGSKLELWRCGANAVAGLCQLCSPREFPSSWIHDKGESKRSGRDLHQRPSSLREIKTAQAAVKSILYWEHENISLLPIRLSLWGRFSLDAKDLPRTPNPWDTHLDSCRRRE